MKKAAMLLFIVLLATGVMMAQEKSLSNFKYQFKIGVLPFMDATGTGNEETGTAVGRAVQAELVHSTNLIGRVLKMEEGMTADDIDPQKAVEMGRARKVDVVLIGTVLEAEQQQSGKGIDGVRIFGQSLGGRAQRASATVTIQADLFNVTNGKKIDSFRVAGKASDTELGGDAQTTLGSLSSNPSEANSPLGKALNNAVVEVVKRIAASEAKMIRYQADAATSSPEQPQQTEDTSEE